MTSQISYLRLLVALISILTICSCQPFLTAPTQAAQAQVAQSSLQVIIQSDTPGKEEVQTIEIDNCNGKSDLTRTEQRSQSIDVTVSAEIAAKIGASIEVISADVQATVGASRTSGASRTTGINLTAPPKTKMVFQIVWIGNEQIGIVQNVRNSNIPIAFRGFTPTDWRIKSQQDIGCPGSSAPQPVLPIPPTYTPLPTLTPYPTLPSPILIPTVAPTSIPVPQASSPQPLRSHTLTSIGSGVFTKATFSDGQLPYDENWLWANNHFNIQRIRREEQPSGCDVSKYQVNKIWVGTAGVAKVTVNGSEIGTITSITSIQKHGYVVDASLNKGDRICLSPIPADGFHIIFGPDIYYHHDSYCYRGNC